MEAGVSRGSLLPVLGSRGDVDRDEGRFALLLDPSTRYISATNRGAVRLLFGRLGDVAGSRRPRLFRPQYRQLLVHHDHCAVQKDIFRKRLLARQYYFVRYISNISGLSLAHIFFQHYLIVSENYLFSYIIY